MAEQQLAEQIMEREGVAQRTTTGDLLAPLAVSMRLHLSNRQLSEAQATSQTLSTSRAVSSTPSPLSSSRSRPRYSKKCSVSGL